jgi:hypothetical protein
MPEMTWPRWKRFLVMLGCLAFGLLFWYAVIWILVLSRI